MIQFTTSGKYAKRHLATFSVAFFLVINANAQFSIGMQTCIAFPWNKVSMPDGNLFINADGSREIQLFDVSFGKGVEYAVRASYRKKAFEYWMQVGYLDGSASTKTVSIPYLNEKDQITYSGAMFWASPGVTIKMNKNKISPYLGLGLNIGFNGKIIMNGYSEGKYNKSESRYVYSKSVPMGIRSSLGIEYSVFKNKNVVLNLNVQSISASFSPTKGTVTKFIKNGVNLLDELSTNSRQAIYKRNYVYDPNAPVDQSKPYTGLRNPFPFSSIGINIGILYIIK